VAIIVAETPNTPDKLPEIPLKDPALAAFLGWLVPGWGHWYQGRRAKAVLFFVSIMGIFSYGLYLSSSSQEIPDANGNKTHIGYARAVYFAWNQEEWRLPFLCQVGVGLPSLPAVIQAMRVSGGNAPMGSFMAPPRTADADNQQPTLSQLHYCLNYYLELATTYTMIGGLLNVLAIYDAYAGPVLILPAKKEEEEKDEKKKAEEKTQG
jgi:hypothetical protein